MRTALAALLMFAATAHADAPVTVRGETIVIEGKVPEVVAPKPKKNYQRIAPRYSDAAIERDVWAKAWLVLAIDERGNVTHVKLLKRPGHDLDQIAIDQAFKMKFAPAEDALGKPMPSQLIWAIEWPSYGWMIAMEGLATRIPAGTGSVPCAGSGPLPMDSVHPVYRDCSVPDLTKAAAVPWILAPR
jgi:hypothetical protein